LVAVPGTIKIISAFRVDLILELGTGFGIEQGM
jgi:hypothetical protein